MAFDIESIRKSRSAERTALTELQLNPLKFLKSNAIYTPGAGDVGGLKKFSIIDETHSSDNQEGKITFLKPNFFGVKKRVPHFQIINKTLDLNNPGTEFDAIFVPVTKYNGSPNLNEQLRQFTKGVKLVNSNFMFTTQLTGCCIVVASNGSKIKVTHWQPNLLAPGIELSQLFHFIAKENYNGYKFKVFGKDDYHFETTAKVYFIGVKIRGKWHFYSQTQTGNFDKTVTGAKELFAMKIR